MEQQTTTFELTWVKELNKQLYQEWEAKGFHDGEAKGEAKAIRGKIIRVATRRGLVLSDEQQQCIHACEDRQALDRWFDNVLDAKTANEIFL